MKPKRKRAPVSEGQALDFLAPLSAARQALLDRPRPFGLAGVFLTALVLRLIFLHQFNQSPFGDHLHIDAAAYDRWGWAIAQGDWLGKGAFYQSPLYPYFLGLVYSVFGHSLRAVQWIQVLLGSFSCVLLYFVGRRVFGETAGWLTAVLAALYQPFIFYDAVLLKGSTTVFLEALTLLCLLRAPEPASARWALAGGACLGLAALNRGNFLLAVPFIPLWLWARTRDIKSAARLGGLFLLGFAFAVAPVTARNYWADRDFVLTNYTAGINFYAGNNPKASGIHAAAPMIRTIPEHEERDARVYAEKEVGRPLKPSEIGRFWYKKGFDFIRREPGRFFRLLGKKINLFVNYYEVPDNYNTYFLRDRFVPLLRWPLFTFGALLPLAVWGVAASWRRWREALLLYLLAGGYALSVVLFYVTSRYRLPVVPFLLPFAAYALADGFGTVREKRWRSTLWRGLLFGCVYICCHVTLFEETRLYAREYVNMGNFLIESRPGRAWQTYEEGIALEKAAGRRENLANLYFAYGIGLRNRKEYRRASACFYSTLHYDPRFGHAMLELKRLSAPTAHFHRGNELLAKGDPRRAEQAFLREIEENPLNAHAHNNLGAICVGQKRWEDGLKHLREAAALNPFFTKAHNNLGTAYAGMGKTEAAREAWRRSLEIDPDQPNITRYLRDLDAR
ncbi:MAG: tetratricopeptide repeat protein [Elusimicrobiota bacterium]